MAKLFCIVRMASGVPDIDFEACPVRGYVFADKVAGFGAYLFSGTGPQLAALNALPQVVGIVAVTQSGDVRWAELDGVIASAVRTKLNNWLTAHGYPNIPAGWNYRRVVREVFQRLNAWFDLDQFDVTE